MILAPIPKIMPVSQNLFRKRVFSRHTTKNSKKDVIGISVAAKWAWAKNRGMVRRRTIKVIYLTSEPFAHQFKNRRIETPKIRTFRILFCV